MLFNYDLLFIAGSVIVLGLFMYSFYNNIFRTYSVMQLNKFFTNPLVLVLVLVSGIFIYTYHNTIVALCLPTIYCDLYFETLVNFLLNFLRHFNLEELIVTLSNLEYLQNIVGIPTNGYDIDVNNPGTFFEMLFQSQDLSVELVEGV